MKKYKYLIDKNLENHNIQLALQTIACFYIYISNGVTFVLYLSANHVSPMFLFYPMLTMCQLLLYMKTSKEHAQPMDVTLVFAYPIGTVVFLKRQLDLWIGKQK